MGDAKITTDSLIFPERKRLPTEEVQGFINNRDYFQLKKVLADTLAADIVETIDSLELSEQVLVFRLLDKEKAAEVFSLLDHDAQEELLENFGQDRVKAIIEEMDPDDLTELFDELPDKVVRQLVRLLPLAERSVGRSAHDPRVHQAQAASLGGGGDREDPPHGHRQGDHLLLLRDR
jgi:Mg/Co/Ni transporter MgtE